MTAPASEDARTTSPLPPGVVVAGHLCVDLLPHFDAAPSTVPGDLFDTGPLRIAPGGSVANTAAALRALDVPVQVVSDVGDDALGTLVGPLLRGLDVDPAGIRVVPGATTSYSVVVQPPEQDRTFWHHAGVNLAFDGAAVPVDAAPLLHLGYLTLLPALVGDDGSGLVSLLERARAAGTVTSVDLAVVSGPTPASHEHWRRVLTAALPHVDLCSPSRDDLRSALGPELEDPDDPAAGWAEWLVAHGCAVAVVSAGADGFALAAADGARFAQAGPLLSALAGSWAGRRLRVPAQDVGTGPLATTGAGDAATAGLLAAVLAGLAPEPALQRAAATAARRITGTLLRPPV